MPQSHFTLLDWAILIIYFLGTMAIGFSFWRKSRSTEGFTAANRSLPGWVCGLSIFATYLSSISFLALPGKAYAANWNPFVFSLSLPIATLIARSSAITRYLGSRSSVQLKRLRSPCRRSRLRNTRSTCSASIGNGGVERVGNATFRESNKCAISCLQMSCMRLG